MFPRSFFRWTGSAMVFGGALTALISIALTPVVAASHLPFTETATTTVFLWRQSLSAFAAILLLFGSVGLYLHHAKRAGLFGAIAFVLAFVGTALLLAWEWVDIFVLRELALQSPAALQALEEAKGMHLYDLGAIIPVSIFTLGWIALAVSTGRTCPTLRRTSAFLIAGFFATPLLTLLLGPVWGSALGNVILGSSWIFLGLAVQNDESEATNGA